MTTTIKFIIQILLFTLIMYGILDMTTIDVQNKLPVSLILGMFLAALSAIEGNTRKE